MEKIKVRILVKKICLRDGQNKKDRSALLSEAGRELLETGAAAYFGISREEGLCGLETARNRWGKPYFVRHPEIHFNISHSGAYAACAFGTEPVGLDIQTCETADFMRIAERYFTPADRQRLCQASDVCGTFYRIWTKEESYAKWLGTSLALSIGREEKQGFCRWFEPAQGVQGAVWTGKPGEIQVEHVSGILNFLS